MPAPLASIWFDMVVIDVPPHKTRHGLYIGLAGETEWTKNGRYTGTTELELTDTGVQQVLGTAKILVGPGRLIDPAKVAHVFISPRKRAQATFDLLFEGVGKKPLQGEGKVSTTEDLAEWGYGRYEGLLSKEIRARRKEQGLDQDRPWDIWRDGCEDGESPQQVTERLDQLIGKIYEIQGSYMHGEKPADVVLVSVPHFVAPCKLGLSSPILSAKLKNCRSLMATCSALSLSGGSSFQWIRHCL